MSINIYYSNRIELLRDRLTDMLKVQAVRVSDPFQPAAILVPNKSLQKWLQIQIAAASGVAVNLRFAALERGLWQMLMDLAKSSNEVRLLEVPDLQIMILRLILDRFPGSDSFKKQVQPLTDYLAAEPGGHPALPGGHSALPSSSGYSRAARQLANRLARYYREYEYHRPEMITAWSQGELYLKKTDEDTARMENCQRALYNRIFTAGGLRDQLTEKSGTEYLTLSQFTERVLAAEKPVPEPLPVVHFFGLSLISRFHRQLILRLSRGYDIHIYELNACSEFWEDADTPREERWKRIKKIKAAATVEFELEYDANENDLLKAWGKPGREAVKQLSELEELSGDCIPDLLFCDEECGDRTVLAEVQHQILRRTRGCDEPLKQDTSLQIIGCPGMYREVETVHNSIIENMRLDKNLLLTEIAVMVTDLAAYKPVIAAVFDRQPKSVPYNLVDSSASQDSLFGLALIDLLELSNSRFTRRAVFKLVFNPCFLTAMDIDRDQALTLAEWADSLNIFYGFDADDKINRETDDDLYTWKQGLQRLRLGRIMDERNEEEGARSEEKERNAPANPFPNYGGRVPFSDISSKDPHLSGIFSVTIERLADELKQIRGAYLSCAEWTDKLKTLCDEFLAVPSDRPEENNVRQELFDGLRQFELMDDLGETNGVPVTVMIETVRHYLDSIKSSFGAYLSGGVTVSSLQPMRPIPFKVVYILGLGEGEFPGSKDQSTLDLRSRKRRLGDITTPELNKYMFLETLVSTRAKLYLTYVCRDLQKDREFFPCSVVKQLKTFLEHHVLSPVVPGASPVVTPRAAPGANAEFKISTMPLCGGSAAYLCQRPEHNDTLVNFSAADRMLCLMDLNKEGAIPGHANEIERNEIRFIPAMNPPAIAAKTRPEREIVRLRELKKFLENPVGAMLKRHLRLDDYEEADAAAAEDEPFFSDHLTEYQILTEVLEYYILLRRGAEKDTGEDFRKGFEQDVLRYFDRFYEHRKLRGETPNGPYAILDKRHIRHRLTSWAAPAGEFLVSRADADFFHNVVVGDAVSQKPSDLQFPAYAFDLAGRKLEVHSELPLLWKNRGTGAGSTLLISTAKVNEKKTGITPPTKHIFEAFIFYLLLRANTCAGRGGVTVSDWIGDQPFTIYLLHRSGITAWEYRVSRDNAAEYLHHLTRDFLDQTGFDLLPFEELTGIDDMTESADDTVRREYYEELSETLQDYETSRFRSMTLLDLVKPKVPVDAYAKVVRRFKPLFVQQPG